MPYLAKVDSAYVLGVCVLCVGRRAGLLGAALGAAHALHHLRSGERAQQASTNARITLTLKADLLKRRHNFNVEMDFFSENRIQ